MLTLAFGAALLLGGCADAPKAPSASLPLAGLAVAAAATDPAPPPLPRPSGARALRLDATASRLRIVVFRAGPAARLGHHHLVEAGSPSGELVVPASRLAEAAGALAIPLADLRVDEAAWRQEAGGEFNERPVPPDDVAATRRNLLALLQSEAHPVVRLQLQRLSGTAPYVVADVLLHLAGRRSEHRVALDWREAGDGLHVQGRLPVSLAALGLQAPSVLGGLLRVDDTVVLEAQLRFVPGEAAPVATPTAASR